MLKDPEMAELAEEELPTPESRTARAEANLQLALAARATKPTKKPAIAEIPPRKQGATRPACLRRFVCACTNGKCGGEGWKIEIDRTASLPNLAA